MASYIKAYIEGLSKYVLAQLSGLNASGEVEEISVTSGAAHVASSVRNASSVTPHDSNANAFDGLWIGTAGDVAVRLTGMSSGSVTFKNVPIGFFPIRTSLVLSTGTTALNILGLTF